jgi:hypothetical protein
MSMKRATPSSGHATNDDGGDESDMSYPAKRWCGRSGSALGGRAALLADLLFRVVLPTADERNGGRRHLQKEDELALTEAFFPLANDLVHERWFWTVDGYVRGCLAAGARRVLARSFRDAVSAPVLSSISESLPRLVHEVLAKGSSWVLAVVRGDLFWGSGSVVSGSVVQYCERTKDPEDVVYGIVNRVAHQPWFTAEIQCKVLTMLAKSGHGSVAARLAADGLADDGLSGGGHVPAEERFARDLCVIVKEQIRMPCQWSAKYWTHSSPTCWSRSSHWVHSPGAPRQTASATASTSASTITSEVLSTGPWTHCSGRPTSRDSSRSRYSGRVTSQKMSRY